MLEVHAEAGAPFSVPIMSLFPLDRRKSEVKSDAKVLRRCARQAGPRWGVIEEHHEF